MTIHTTDVPEPVTREELASLLEQMAKELRGTPAPPPRADSPADATSIALRTWRKARELAGQRYTWPQGTEEYDPFEVWQTDDGGERLELGLGYVAADPSADYYGRPRGYWLAFEMVNGQKRRPVCVFIEGDDPNDLVAVVKGKGAGGRSMYAPGDDLPAVYDDLAVDVFRNRVNGPQAYNRLAVVAPGGDRHTMLNHAAIQLRLRG
jgi:hypothetical protein